MSGSAENNRCPKGGCALRMLYGASLIRFLGSDRFLSCLYCPCCDLSTLEIAREPGGSLLDRFLFQRQGSHWTLVSGSTWKLAWYLQWDFWRTKREMKRSIDSFIAGRDRLPTRCPWDAAHCSWQREAIYQGRSKIYFLYCHFCNEYFAYLKDKNYGWQVVLSFIPKAEGKWEVREQSEAEADTQRIQMILEGLIKTR